MEHAPFKNDVMLELAFTKLLRCYTNDDEFIEHQWSTIQKKYSNKSRHYHNLSHLDNLLLQLTAVKDAISDWDTILFTMFYHDIVYNVMRKDNEERSAMLATEILESINYRGEKKLKCEHQILATKKHIIDDDTDTNFFLDADLSILGQAWEMYEAYYSNIRKEYAIVPDLIYKKERVKVLRQFLAMESIFKTPPFIAACEMQARKNIALEIKLLDV